MSHGVNHTLCLVICRVALLLSGRGVCEEKASSLAELIQAGAGNLSLAVVSVSVIGKPHILHTHNVY